MMMYWALLMDFTLLSMRISAFVLARALEGFQGV